MAIFHYTSTDLNRFWTKVDKSGGEDACWLWTAGLFENGYGVFLLNKKLKKAHRISWELAYGEIPEHLMVLHDCPDGDNPACVNPKHLWLGTHKQNMTDRNQKKRQMHGEHHFNAKLTLEQVVEIRHLFDQGTWTQTDLARKFGMSSVQIRKIVHNIQWKLE